MGLITPFGACPARRAGPLRLCGAGRFGGTLSCTPDAPGRLCAAVGGALGLRCSRPLRSAPCALCAAFSWRPVGRLSALAAAVPRAPCRRRASPSPSGVVARAGVLVGFPAALSPRILNPSPALPSVAPVASVSAHNFIPPPRSLRSRRPLPVPGRGLCASRPPAADARAGWARARVAGARWVTAVEIPCRGSTLATVCGHEIFSKNLTPLTGFFRRAPVLKLGKKRARKAAPGRLFSYLFNIRGNFSAVQIFKVGKNVPKKKKK